jgi:glycosyltransferase involved in cell wall biosynthesis
MMLSQKVSKARWLVAQEQEKKSTESAEAMKIVHLGLGITPVPPIKSGGIEEIIYQLTRYLGCLGCQVHVIDIKGGEQQKQKRLESSAEFHEVWHPPLPHRYNSPFLQRFFSYLLLMLHVLPFALLSSLALNRLFGREKIDVIHAHSREAALGAMVVNKLRRNTAVMIYMPQSAYGTKKLSWYKKLINFAEIPALKWADHIVAQTPAVKRWLVSEFNLDPAKITQIYSGISLEEVEQLLTREEGACHQSNIVLCAGEVNARKNQFTAVKAIPQVVAEYPEVKFVFAGPISDTKYFNSIQRFIAENNLSSYIEFRGMLTRQELYNLYSDAILFLFPTTAESQGLVLIEAMAFGLPVIASTIEPIADVVSQKEGSAILVDPYDVDGIAMAIIRLLQDSPLRQSMSLRAQELAQSLSFEHIAAQTLALYQELVQNKHK